MPDFVTKNKGHNRYFIRLLILGLFGLVMQLLVAVGRKRTFDYYAFFFYDGLLIVFLYQSDPLFR